VVAKAGEAEGKHIVLYGLFGIGNTGNDATLDVTIDGAC